MPACPLANNWYSCKTLQRVYAPSLSLGVWGISKMAISLYGKINLFLKQLK
jgi:hypothetical protein